ncbi:MAG: thioredoxin domain-containing protein [Pseudomonadota bacterium]
MQKSNLMTKNYIIKHTTIYITYIAMLLLSYTSSTFFSLNKKTYYEPIDIDIRFNEKKDIWFGNKNAKTIVVEYVSYDCHFCKDYILNTFPKINEWIEENKILYIVKPEIKSTTVLHWITTGYYLFHNHPINSDDNIKQRNKAFHKYRHQMMQQHIPISESNKTLLLQEYNITQDKFNEFQNEFNQFIKKQFLLIQKKVNFSPAMIISSNNKTYVTTGKDIYKILKEKLNNSN